MPIYQLVLPAMGESVSEATITQWLKKVGDTVAADEAVVEVATDKVDSEVASEYSGVIKEILHPINAVVAVDEPMVLIETDEAVAQDAAPSVKAATESVVEQAPIVSSSKTEETAEVFAAPEQYMEQAQEAIKPVTQAAVGEKRFYSPLVKSIAKQEQISNQELASITGSGKDGRVTKSDVLAFVETRTSAHKPQQNTPKVVTQPPVIPVTSPAKNNKDAVVPMTRMEQMISEHMTRSLQTSAHVQSFIEIDVTKLWNWR